MTKHSKFESVEGPPAKTEDEHFIDWYESVFPYGYGTGEEHILPALKQFFDLVPPEGGYDYAVLEIDLDPVVTWLLISALCEANVLEYGTSPRYAWLDFRQGRALKAYIDGKTAEELLDLVTSRTEDSTPCYPDACNCGPDGYDHARVCPNPFWRRKTG